MCKKDLIIYCSWFMKNYLFISIIIIMFFMIGLPFLVGIFIKSFIYNNIIILIIVTFLSLNSIILFSTLTNYIPPSYFDIKDIYHNRWLIRGKNKIFRMGNVETFYNIPCYYFYVKPVYYPGTGEKFNDIVRNDAFKLYKINLKSYDVDFSNCRPLTKKEWEKYNLDIIEAKILLNEHTDKAE